MLRARFVVSLSVVVAVLAFVVLPAQAAQTTIEWYGQSAFRIATPAGHVLLIDPWIINPVNAHGKEDVAALGHVDLILVSHGHFDHVGQAAEISKRTGARLVATYDLGNALIRYGGFPPANAGFDTLGNAGGVLAFFDGEVRIAFVPAVHSSTVNPKDLGVSNDDESHYGGSAGGFVIMIRGGPTIYHTGDTDFFGDMVGVRKFGAIDLMLVCIGDHFTMGPERAADAVALVGPKRAVPMHYGTFLPAMTGTPEGFRAALQARGIEGRYGPMVVHAPESF